MSKFIALLVIFACSTAIADTRYVDLNCATPTPPFTSWETAATNIQDAVDAAVDGDTVVVADGVYKYGGAVISNLHCRISLTNAIIVQSVNGPESTFIVGDGPPVSSNAVRCAYLTTGSHLIGFTLTKGQTRMTGIEEWDSIGGGALLNGGSLTDCTIVSNSAVQGGGINFQEGGTALNCIVRSNYADFTGGGVRFHFGGSLDNCFISDNFAFYGGGADINHIGVIDNCNIISNRAAYSGGGIWFYYGGTASNCNIIANSATSGGGGVYCASGGDLVNCSINSNRVSGTWNFDGGGGVRCSGRGTLVNCEISVNSARKAGGVEMEVFDGEVGELINCTVVGNRASDVGGILCLDGRVNNCISSGNSSTNGSNDLVGNPGSIVSSCSPDLYHGVDGNITNAPAFVDPENGDYRLLATSPCIDTGSNGVITTPIDLTGNPRIIDGDFDGTATVDMGAYEFRVMGIPEVSMPRINPKSKGRTPLTIFSTDDFDATTIDPSTVRLAGAAPVKDIQEDEDNDGDIDLKLHFMTSEMAITTGSEMMLIGQTYDGGMVVGMDAVNLVPGK